MNKQDIQSKKKGNLILKFPTKKSHWINTLEFKFKNIKHKIKNVNLKINNIKNLKKNKFFITLYKFSIFDSTNQRFFKLIKF